MSTNTIRSQALEALKKPHHPYREAIDAAFDGRVAVFDIAEIETIRPQDLTERVCVSAPWRPSGWTRPRGAASTPTARTTNPTSPGWRRIRRAWSGSRRGAIAALKEVRHWVRNLATQPRASFWLPTATDRFHPDFVAELHDSRILVVEYKGEAYKTNDDSREKREIGRLWEEKSGGRGLFLMAERRDGQGKDVHRQLAEKVCGPGKE